MKINPQWQLNGNRISMREYELMIVLSCMTIKETKINIPVKYLDWNILRTVSRTLTLITLAS